MQKLVSLLATEHLYAYPEAVGYKSWLTLFGRAVAFRQLDGTLLLRW